jgi:hypothetical protein
MEVLTENIYLRGTTRMAYVRRRIPAALRTAYPPKVTHIIRSLGTSNVRDAKRLGRLELARIDAEFEQRHDEMDGLALVFFALFHALITRVAECRYLVAMQQRMCLRHVADVAGGDDYGVVKPDAPSTPMWAFNPKCQSLPFFRP